MPKSLFFKNIKSLIFQASPADYRKGTVSQESSRRSFIKSSIATTAALIPITQILGGCKTGLQRQVSSSTLEAPVVILGGGIAGLTAAYRLTQASVPCSIFEASARLGGRMFTKTKFNDEGMTCELGGELVDSNHQDLISLCKELEIEIDDFTAEDAGLAANLYYLNQKYYTEKDLIPLFKPFAKRLKRDQKKIQKTSYAKKMDSQNLDDYLSGYRDVQKWIVELIRIAYIGECGVEPADQSALSLLYALSPDTKEGFKIYGDSDESKRIRGGNASLIQKLEEFLKARGVAINTQSPVVKIEDSHSGLKITINKNGETQTILGKKVICTIPFSVLRTIDGVSTLKINPLKKKCIQELGYATCGKVMIGYRSKIWRLGLAKGTTMVPKSNGMVYTDLNVQNLWETSRTQVGSSGILTSFTGGKLGSLIGPASRDRAIDNIEEIFPGTKLDFDGHSAVMNWTTMPYNLGAFATPKPGQVIEFSEINWTPELSGKLIFAGEHIADKFQGFMNGACRSGNRAAELVLQARNGAHSELQGYL